MATDEKWMPEWLEEVRTLKADLAEARQLMEALERGDSGSHNAIWEYLERTK